MEGPKTFDPKLAQDLIEQRSATHGAALPILHAFQHTFGYIPDEAIALMATALNISKAEALGVASFYPDFRRAPVDCRVLKLCRAESCQAMGCEDLVAHLEHHHGVVVDHAERGDRLAVETVYCLGHCALSPSAMLDGEPIGRLDRDRLDAIVVGEGARSQ